jgi:hypothetical protein
MPHLQNDRILETLPGFVEPLMPFWAIIGPKIHSAGNRGCRELGLRGRWQRLRKHPGRGKGLGSREGIVELAAWNPAVRAFQSFTFA